LSKTKLDQILEKYPLIKENVTNKVEKRKKMYLASIENKKKENFEDVPQTGVFRNILTEVEKRSE